MILFYMVSYICYNLTHYIYIYIYITNNVAISANNILDTYLPFFFSFLFELPGNEKYPLRSSKDLRKIFRDIMTKPNIIVPYFS